MAASSPALPSPPPHPAPDQAPATHGSVSTHPTGPHPLTGKLILMATGVVFGDIGTSPLYALKECVDPGHGVAATQANLLGLLSLVIWSLMMVVTVKYLMFIMRADNHGEGGILALLALGPPKKPDAQRLGW